MVRVLAGFLHWKRGSELHYWILQQAGLAAHSLRVSPSSFSNGKHFCLFFASQVCYSRNSVSNMFSKPVCAGSCRNTWAYFLCTSPTTSWWTYLCAVINLHWPDEETKAQRWKNWWEVTQLVSSWAGICTKAACPFYSQSNVSRWAQIAALLKRKQKG